MAEDQLELLASLIGRVNSVTLEETKRLKVDIANSALPDGLKAIVSANLDRIERMLGNYFTLIDELFVNDETYEEIEQANATAEGAFYESCCRDRYHRPEDQAKLRRENRKRKRDGLPVQGERSMKCRSGAAGEQNDAYMATYKSALQQTEAATKPGQSRTSTHNRLRRSLWLSNVVGEPHSAVMQIAHLVPASVDAARSFWFVVEFLFGTDTLRSWDEIDRLLHGSNGLMGGKFERVSNSGIKHMITNKILLASQFDYLDTTPCVIIIPILNRNDRALNVRNWAGEGYEAIMLIDSYVCGDDDSEDGYEASPLATVAQATGYTYYTEATNNKAAPEEVEVAMNLVRDYTRAIYYAQNKRKPLEVTFTMEGEEGATLFYPKLPPNHHDLNVRKISFADNEAGIGHPAPDPLLLLSKSIAILQARHRFKIVAAAEPQDYHNPSEQSIDAMDNFLRRQEQSMVHRNPLGMDVVVRGTTRGRQILPT